MHNLDAEGMLITKRGKPIAKLLPASPLIGSLATFSQRESGGMHNADPSSLVRRFDNLPNNLGV